jgi:hypothetical protein
MVTTPRRHPAPDSSVIHCGRVPPADPRDIHLSYAHRHSWPAGPGTARTWHVHADVRYGDIRLADEDPAGHVGDIRIVTIDPGTADDWQRAANTTNSHQHRIAEVVLDPATGQLTRSLTGTAITGPTVDLAAAVQR